MGPYDYTLLAEFLEENLALLEAKLAESCEDPTEVAEDMIEEIKSQGM